MEEENVGVSGLPSAHIEPLRDQVVAALRKAEPWGQGRYTAEEIIDMVYDGRASLFVAYEPDGEGFINLLGVVACYFNDYPSERWLFILAVGGDKSALWRQNMRELLRDYAESNNCVGFEWVGRVSLLRLFPESHAIGIAGEMRFGRRGEQDT